MKSLSVSFSIVLLSISLGGTQTVFPPTIKVPVTFYDFHTDGSNPDFEPGLRACGFAGCIAGTGLHINETGGMLDVVGKPILGSFCYFSQRLAKWFRPWQPGDYTSAVYSAAGEYLHDTTWLSDTAYKTVTIQDSLIFTYVPLSQGVYQYASTSFFPLDGKGFGNEPAGSGHNCGFTVQFHWEFAFSENQVLTFKSCGDLWVFVNGRLAIDLGGIHDSETASVVLRDLPGVANGHSCIIDAFYAQRHADEADILISMSIMAIEPPIQLSRMTFHRTATVDSTPTAEAIAYKAVIMDDTGGERHDLDPLIKWSLWPASTASSLSSTTGGVDTLFLRPAYSMQVIGAIYIDNSVTPAHTFSAFDTIYFFVKPNYKLWIEPDTDIDLNNTTASMLHRLQFPDSISLVNLYSKGVVDTVVAVRRDEYGNFACFPSNVVWQVVGDTGIVRLSTPGKPYLCTIEGVNYGSTFVRVSDDSGSSPDTIRVVNNYYEHTIETGSSIVSRTSPATPEYFNLCGQKLRSSANSRIDGIVVEKIVGLGGKTSVTRRLLGPGSRWAKQD